MVQLAGRKISKSLGNLVMVQDLLKEYSPDAIRLYLAGQHYRRIWEHDTTELEQAGRLAATLRTAVTVQARSRLHWPLDPGPSLQAFTRAMAHDLDTPAALKILSSLAQEIIQAAQAGRAVQAMQDALRMMCRIFALRLDDVAPESAVIAGWNDHLKQALQQAPGSAKRTPSA
jgi:cysteinyl-tRNA synthetase